MRKGEVRPDLQRARIGKIYWQKGSINKIWIINKR